MELGKYVFAVLFTIIIAFSLISLGFEVCSSGLQRDIEDFGKINIKGTVYKVERDK